MTETLTLPLPAIEYRDDPRYAVAVVLPASVAVDDLPRQILDGRIDAADGLRAYVNATTEVLGYKKLLALAAAFPEVRRKVIADMRALGSKEGKLPPNKIEIAAVWRAFDDHYANRGKLTEPSKNAALKPIAERLGLRQSRVKTILYDPLYARPRPHFSRNPMVPRKS